MTSVAHNDVIGKKFPVDTVQREALVGSGLGGIHHHDAAFINTFIYDDIYSSSDYGFQLLNLAPHVFLGYKMTSQIRLRNPLFHPFLFVFQIFQWLVDLILAPTPPDPKPHLGRPKIAIIGAGITGVSSAAHCIGHGFDVVIFEAGTKKSLGGIWSVSD
jgi:hypothetical protein